MRKLLLLFFSAIILQCQNDEGTQNHLSAKIPQIDPLLQKKIENVNKFADLLTLKKTVHLETTKESLIGQIEAIYYLPGKKLFLILDSSSAKGIFIFQENGNFLYKIGKNGKGPGEYVEPRSIAYNENEIIVYNFPPSKLLFYTLEGNYLYEISFASKHWQFVPDKMLLWNKNLYIYTNNPDLRKAPDGKEYRVFRLKNGKKFDRAFGEPEETFDFGDGGIVAAYDKVYYTGIYNGNLYQINPFRNSVSILSSLGKLTDLNKIKNSQNPLQYIVTHINDIDSFLQVGVINNLIFLQRHSMITVISLSGEIIRKDIPKNLNLPTDFDSYASRLGFSFYQKGIIVPANLKSRIKGNHVPNPSLLLYELKDN